MKICHVTSVHDLRIDARILPKMAASAQARGHEVVVIARRRAGLFSTGNGSGKVPVELVDLPEARLERWRCLDRVISVARAQRADLYHLHDPELLSKAHRLRDLNPSGLVVMDFHEWIQADLLDKAYLPLPLRRFGSWLWPVLERKWLAGVDGIVLAGDGYRSCYTCYAIPNEVIHNYPLISHVRDRLPAPPTLGLPLRMMYVGAIMPTRAIREMILAAEVVAKKWKGGAHLNLYGPLDDARYVSQLTAIADPELVTFHGILAQEKLMETLQSMHLSFALFYDRPASYEAIPTKLLESLLAGVPVVASDRPVMRWFLSPPAGGLLIDRTAPERIAQAVLEIANDPMFYQDYRIQARRLILQNYTWPIEGERLLRFYERLLQNKRAGQIPSRVTELAWRG